jgi:RNA polymerase sigma-70 factor (ECF subfamily)
MRPDGARVSAGELDDVTLARAQRGDDDAFRALVARYQQPVFAYLHRMLGRTDAQEVEDLAQESFVRVHRGLARFAPAGSARLSTWILTIATRVALNHLRRRRPRAGALPEDLPEPRAEAAIALVVREALARMTPDHRAILLLREIHGLEYQEISQALGIDAGTVRSRLSRAREALRAALSEGEP